MSKQLKIQLGIFVLIVVLFSYFYYSVSKEDNIDKQNLSLSNLDTKEVNENFSNKISDIKYKSSDKTGNQYEISSASGESEIENPEVLNLVDVEGKISILNKETVLIYSDFAKYDKDSLNTHFYGNVRLIYGNHNINSDDLFLNFFDKQTLVKNNIYYTDQQNKLFADIIEIDLMTKISKVYMLEKQKKILVEIKN
tara:strand:+ start:201 stop:788 length:588 start_codon:yes stop_codon:yes gene_type:complete